MTSAAQVERLDNLVGVQTPHRRVVPPRQTEEAGREACRFYRKMTGRVVFPWQELAVCDAMAERFVPDDPDAYPDPYAAIAAGAAGRWKWAAANYGLIVARQNGKGDVLMIIELYWLFVLKARRIFHTAQLQRTASDAHQRMAEVIRNSPKLLAQLKGGERGIRNGKGDESIVMADGRSILFFTRSDNAGRGLFGDLLVCDESYDLTVGELAALRPLIKTSPFAQVIYASTPVDKDAMPNGDVLASIRSGALSGRAQRVAWDEWSVPDRLKDNHGRNVNTRDERLDDPKCWAMANPSLGMRIADGRVLVDAETIYDDLHGGLTPRKFLVEDLCAPDFWPDPEQDDADEIPIDIIEFEEAARPGDLLLDPVALGIDRSPGGMTALVVAGWHADGTWGSETLLHRQGTEWVIPALRALVAFWKPAVLVLDAAGPAGALVAKLQAAGFEPVVTGTAEMGRAAQAMVDDFKEGRYVPSGIDSPLNAAVEIARWRPLSSGGPGARAFARVGFGDIAPLVATALAGFGLNLAVAFAKRTPTPPAPEALPPIAGGGADWGAGSVADLATVGF